MYKANEPEFIAEYFPNLAARGRATYDDVFSLDSRQAEALLPLLEDSIRYFLKLDARERNRNVGLIDRRPLDTTFVSVEAKRAEAWTKALKDLCSLFCLPFPM